MQCRINEIKKEEGPLRTGAGWLNSEMSGEDVIAG